jgi:NAD(P)-dependent dehydrogenase (short-subunit alcohol dehydrogenase family)
MGEARDIEGRRPASDSLPGKVVLVCGVGPDLGRSLAVRAAQAGADVVLAARNGERLEAVAREVAAVGRRALQVVTDVTDPESRRRLVATCLDAFGRVDVLVNAAFDPRANVDLMDTDLGDLRRFTDVNVLASVGLAQDLAPTLKEHRGAIVLVSSIVLRNRLSGYGAYRMDKAALLAVARTLSIELGPYGVRVNSVAPGYIWGDKLRRAFERGAAHRGVSPEALYDEVAAETDLRRLPTPDEIADAAVFLASDLASGITGQCLDVTCGQTHH